jgi:hypothetical protein
MARKPVDTNTALMAVTIAAFVAVAFYLLLSLVARPHGLTTRLRQVSGEVAQVETTLAGAKGVRAYSPGAVCHDAGPAAQAALKLRLQGAASAAQVSLTNLTTAAGAGDEAQGGLTPVTFQVEASGHYEAVVALLGSLAKAEPEVFVDTADLKSQTPAVALKLSGRVFCSTAARL